MLLCCSSPMIAADTLTAKAELLAQWGYDAIAVFQPYASWNDAVRAELALLEERTGVRPVEFVLVDDIYGNAMSADDALRRACRDMYRQAADVCAELDLVTEIEYQYGPQNPMPLFEPYQQLSPEQESGFVDFYREMLARVEGSQASILLEPLNRYESRYLNTVRDNLRLIERVAHPNAGLLPDTFHMSIEEASIPDAIREAGDNVRHVHLGDNNRLLPGGGSLDWAAIFAALHEIGYDGAVNLECAPGTVAEESLASNAAFLRELLDAS